MTLEQFIKKYEGKSCEVTGGPLNQCVDLVNAYLKEVWGKPIIKWTNAKDFLYQAKDYEVIKNTPTGIPQRGDVIVWGEGAGGGYGHVGVFLEGNVNRFTSFDQNWTAQVCKKEGHYYKNVIGWFRPRGDTMTTKTEHERDEALKSMTIWRETAEKAQSDLKEAKSEIKVLKQKTEDEKKRYTELISEISELLLSQQNLPAIKESINRLITFEDKTIKQEKTIEKLQSDIVKMKDEGVVVVREATHSRFCAWLARRGY